MWRGRTKLLSKTEALVSLIYTLTHLVLIMDFLNFNQLEEDGHRLKQSYLDALSDAAAFCFDRHHSSPQKFRTVNADKELTFNVRWEKPDAFSKVTWANRDDATEAGACAVALAIVHKACGFVVVTRAETLTGVDYFLAKAGESHQVAGLEVSGVDAGGKAELHARLRKKISQATEGESRLPAIVLVVGFKALRALLADVSEK